MKRYNVNEPMRLAVFRSRDEQSFMVNSHKEVIPMGYVDTLEEFEGYVRLEYPNAVKREMISHRGTGSCYYCDGNYNIFYHEVQKLNTINNGKEK